VYFSVILWWFNVNFPAKTSKNFLPLICLCRHYCRYHRKMFHIDLFIFPKTALLESLFTRASVMKTSLRLYLSRKQEHKICEYRFTYVHWRYSIGTLWLQKPPLGVQQLMTSQELHSPWQHPGTGAWWWCESRGGPPRPGCARWWLHIQQTGAQYLCTEQCTQQPLKQEVTNWTQIMGDKVI
jgi:hypothetical protein